MYVFEVLCGVFNEGDVVRGTDVCCIRFVGRDDHTLFFVRYGWSSFGCKLNIV